MITTDSVPTAATSRAGRSRSRNESTSASVYLPELRIRSARKNSTGTNAMIAAIRPTKASTPNRYVRPAKPRNEDADM